MAKFTSVANEWAKKFIYAKDKKYALNSIIYDINYLVYSSTKQPLSYKDKSVIFRYIFDIIAGREELKDRDNEQLTPEFSDITLFFERRSYILKQLKTGVQKQAQLN